MSTRSFDQEIEETLSKERQILLDKLTKIFDPKTADDYVSPKTNETRQQLTIDELRRLNYNQSEEILRRLRSLEHYQTTMQSLSRVDLEASYQAFVRNQVAQQSPRYELERFVRNASDIDAAKRYLSTANDALINPQQSLLLFRSSKLNEQKANRLKSSGYMTSLQQNSADPSIQKYFPETFHGDSTYPRHDDEEEQFFHDQYEPTPRRSIHLEHHEKKYHIEFLKESHPTPEPAHLARNRHLPYKELIPSRNVESLFSAENSTVQHRSAYSQSSAVHRETFPPLSLSALKEYRPTFTPKLTPLRERSAANKNPQRRKSTKKADFMWQRSMVSSTHNE